MLIFIWHQFSLNSLLTFCEHFEIEQNIKVVHDFKSSYSTNWVFESINSSIIDFVQNLKEKNFNFLSIACFLVKDFIFFFCIAFELKWD